MKKFFGVMFFLLMSVALFSQDIKYVRARDFGNYLNQQTTITGAKSFTGAMTFGSTLSVSGTSTLTGNVTLGGLLVGNSSMRDTAVFTTTSKYIYLKVPGVTPTDRFLVIPIMASRTATPGTGEFLGYYAKTDSLIITRNTGTTSGLKVFYMRIK